METCWTVIRSAARGDGEGREQFVRRYEHAVRAYLGARWRESGLLQELDDAVQEIFLECFKDDGVLARSDEQRGGGFRPFLFGVARNVARRVEERAARKARLRQPGSFHPDRMEKQDTHLSHAFDRAWARSIMRQAAAQQRVAAGRAGAGALRRVEILRLRFEEGLPIREIARKWNAEAAALHREYAKAREEFHAALKEVVAFHLPERPEAVDGECAGLLTLLA